MKLPDVNVLIHASNMQSLAHERAREWMAEMARGDEPLGLVWMVLIGFLRISTRPGILSKPLSVGDALAAVQGLLKHPNARIVDAGPQHAALLGRLLLGAGTAGNLTGDAHLAAIAIEHGATLVSFDRDFERFAGLRFEHLA